MAEWETGFGKIKAFCLCMWGPWKKKKIQKKKKKDVAGLSHNNAARRRCVNTCVCVRESVCLQVVGVHGDRRHVSHTHSSADISRGLMYSKPSNSDWSIFLTTSLKKQRDRGMRRAGWKENRSSELRGIKGGGGKLLVVGRELDGLVGELGVEVVQSEFPRDVGFERRDYLLLLQLKCEENKEALKTISSVPISPQSSHPKVLTPFDIFNILSECWTNTM